jgi:hypothetical protein
MPRVWKPYNAPLTKEDAMTRHWLPVDVAADLWGLTAGYLTNLCRATMRGKDVGLDRKGVAKVGKYKIKPETLEAFFQRPQKRSYYARRVQSVDKMEQ